MRRTIILMTAAATLGVCTPASAALFRTSGALPTRLASSRTDADGTQHLRFLAGPVPAAPGQNLIGLLPKTLEGPPIDGYITMFKPDFIRLDGTTPPVEQVHMHHGVFFNLSRRDVTDPTLPERYFAFAEEKTTGSLPPGYGYPYHAADVLGINFMIHNETPNTELTFIVYEMTFVPASTLKFRTMKPVRPVWMDVENGKIYPVFDALRGDGGVDGHYTFPDDAAGAYGGGPKRNEWTVDREGSLIFTAGHLHPGGLYNDLDLVRGGRQALLFRSVAKYFDPNGPVSWDMAMTVTPPDWKVAVHKGDLLRTTVTYETNRASWYESMGIMIAFMADDQAGAADAFSGAFPTGGNVTHGEFKAATNFGGQATGTDDPRDLPDGATLLNGVGIAGFQFLPGDQFSALMPPNPPVIQPGQRLTFGNFDAAGLIYHTITACQAPCTGRTGVSYPLADGPVQFDSRQLGVGVPGLTAASQTPGWATPKDLAPGTYTYFCRVHPFMRGAFRVAGAQPSGAPAAAAPAARARLRLRTRPVRVRHGIASVPVACKRGGAACRGTLMIWAGGKPAGAAPYRVRAGRPAVVRVALPDAVRRRLAHRGRLAVRIVAVGSGASSAARTMLVGT